MACKHGTARTKPITELYCICPVVCTATKTHFSMAILGWYGSPSLHRCVTRLLVYFSTCTALEINSAVGF